ncbi:protein translocase subunit SecF [Cellulomonas cellasea]|uniref:Protein-export membrane protein SecF n=2 Tax=Cellulomonas cellasea TaxID=43670 RepID=A0A0A0BAC1_9CELL|nr:protein translocase subunit SecF [Cellulomonas cellasea]KGM03123.1 preprotein translocase subunit SecF [Cellulomonas cellasea DSM 20118]GEA88829.1 protein-export membrane protein SecF [Cellulomonas cellasea]
MASGFAQWGNDLYTGRRSYDIVGKRRLWFLIGAVLVLISAVLLVRPGLNPGIEFRGGSEFRINEIVDPAEQPAIDAVTAVSEEEEARVSRIGSNALRVQTATLTSEEVEEVRTALAEAYDVSTDQVTSSFIGPTWGADVSDKAIRGLLVFLGLVTVVMTLYFRNWRMAAAALIALFHDLVVTVGVYAAVGWEVTPATVIGFLTILGYSLYDTVVVFDKVRENTVGVLDQSKATYAERANLAVNQTLVRSINTSVVALLPVSAILFVGAFILGAGTLRDIALALFVGMAIGTFSSIFLATPFEVALRQGEPKIKEHTARVLRSRTAASEGGEPALAAAARASGQIRPGTHLGTAAQPRRKPSKR